MIYTGGNLIAGQLKAPTSNAPIAWICAVLFIVFGIYLAIDYVRKSMKEFKEENNEEQIEEQIEVEEEKDEE